MIFVRLGIMFFIVYLSVKLIDVLNHTIEKSNPPSVKYFFLSGVSVLLFTTLLLTMPLLALGGIAGPILSLFLIILALAIGFELSGAVSSKYLRVKTVLLSSLALGIIFWPSLYILASVADAMNSQSVLLAKIGVVEFTMLAILSTIVPVVFAGLTERFL